MSSYRILLLFLIMFLAVPAFSQQNTDADAPKTGWLRNIFSGSKKDRKKESQQGNAKPRTYTARIDSGNFVSADNFIEHFGQYIADSVLTVELAMTDSVDGWYVEGNVLRLVNDIETINSGEYYTYESLNRMITVFSANGVALVPLFDLGAENIRFENVTGHVMLSVEGFRFVKALLTEFMESTEFARIAFSIPEGKYRDELSAFMADFPAVVYYFTEFDKSSSDAY